jgi:predicted transcriptional regulator
LWELAGSVSELGISLEIQQFLAESIHSVEQLEILLLLRASPDSAWTVRDVYQRVLTNETSILASLQKLCEQGLVRKVDEQGYQFVSNPDLQRILENLARLYKEMPTRLLHALYGAPRSEIDAFAQAFKIRKSK